MQVLVTGATGFWGRHFLQACAAAGAAAPQVHAWVRRPQSWSAQPWTAAHPDVQVHVGTLDEVSLVRQAPAQLDAVVHLAAVVQHSRGTSPQAQAEAEALNVGGALAAARLALVHNCRLVVASTSGTVACSTDPRAQPDEEAPHCTAVVGRWPYYAAKIRMERALWALRDSHGLQLVLLRPPMLFGPQDHVGRATAQIRRFVRRPLPFILHGGIHYVDVRDAAAALLRSLQVATPRPIYHLRGTACTLRAFFADLEALTGQRAARLALPGGLARALARLDVGLGRRLRGRPLGVFPDPVVVEMAGHFWDMRSRYAKAELNFVARPGTATLAATLADLAPGA